MTDMTLNKAQTIIVLSPLNDVHESNEEKIQLLSSSSLNTGLSGFNLSDFIAPEIAGYLGVRSLVRFGATSKINFAVMTNEIYYRKKCVADIENVVVSLMKTVSHPFRTPTRNEYSQASAAATCAMKLIDDEVNILGTWMCTKSNVNNICKGLRLDRYKWNHSDVFLGERKKFLDYNRSCPESLHILPQCFYFPPIRELIIFPPGIVQKVTSMAWQIWIAYQIVRIKEDDYYKCVKDTAHVLARESHNGMIDSFQIVARELCYSEPNSRACLWSTLEMADKFESQTLGMARTMRIWLKRS